ncbi:MAG: formate C-acetyltransferase/glycerol dehydratase family glycyl radical enzyme [Solobacterium sp.]|nr:formate C-acetyltransferase/glycerol dehydratase family glycyl radical enzyme [Solobacterium sp.]
MNERIEHLKRRMLGEERFASIEQAKIITRIYQENEDRSIAKKRALALKAALEEMEISIDPEELIVGNRTSGVRAGVVFPESGCSWVNREFEELPTRPQDRFSVHPEDIQQFRELIYPYWSHRSMEEGIREEYGEELKKISRVVKINQTDHAQGHICPDVETWLHKGPAVIRQEVKARLYMVKEGEEREFYECVLLVLDGAITYIQRYANKANRMSIDIPEHRNTLSLVAKNCRNLISRPAQHYWEALQSIWFLFVILQMESNASSFSPGRMDQYLYPYYKQDLRDGILNQEQALGLMECLWLKFNQIVYMRNRNSAKYFAGFPIGFNIALGGKDEAGNDTANEVSFICLKAQEEIGLPQPNLSVRLHTNSPHEFMQKAIEVVAKGSGMPQFFNDEAVIEPFQRDLGISREDAYNYAIVGCVELTTSGNTLGWSDAAMFNLCKALELALNHGVDEITGEQLCEDFGGLDTYQSYEELEEGLRKVIDYYIEEMMKAEEVLEKAHQNYLPSAFLSCVIQECISRGVDVTRGGAKYNFSGIQMIQVANLADSLEAIRKLVFEEREIDAKELLDALRADFKGYEILQAKLLNKAPKYGNDIPEVDNIGAKWAEYFRNRMKEYRNYRGGPVHTGMYTVSAHVPMGENVGASADGRNSGTPLADGGMSPSYGRDMHGPTAVLKSVSRLPESLTTNGGLLNMKFLPEFFDTEEGRNKFEQFLRAFVDLKIPHIQFNVVRKEDLLAAKEHPEQYRSLTVRVAGYTAYFVELDGKLQDEIIRRTAYASI